MDNRICGRFDLLRKYLPDDLNSTSKDINRLGDAKNYCSNGKSEEAECKTEVDKINAGFIWLFEQNIINRITGFSDSKDPSGKKHKVFIIYIMLWLNFKLNQKKHAEITEFNDFYNKYIEDNTNYTKCKKKINNDNYGDCSSSLKKNTGYTNFKEFIDENKCLMDIGINDVSNFYDAFKSLCNMYTELNANEKTSKKYLDCAKEFVEKYKKLLNNNDIDTEDSPYYQVFSTLSNDYNNFKSYCNKHKVNCDDIPPLPEKKTTQNPVQSFQSNSEPSSEVISPSSSITNKLIIVLSIFGAIAFFLGISYKYSLFGFRKRSQKQHLREKIKK
ncbi:PIR protein [Plasmodium yoelii]|uniref:PIR protein n=2 Tax=Plasmodium yoelii TaxID=5861 RepID=A0AAE9WUC8_PLAYO|nr:PIR protein [Plasmodium yoelii]WBY60558.1 PIR protein [Plasmodium yoelii yoelii]CDU20374.1 YIR protein [Plasmodium yoelii]VTZ81334.1 PIR protein [Plasmodium yoelii]|eukprot:XP_022812789.1 PIR protein [Plasmodium yoelii]